MVVASLLVCEPIFLLKRVLFDCWFVSPTAAPCEKPCWLCWLEFQRDADYGHLNGKHSMCGDSYRWCWLATADSNSSRFDEVQARKNWLTTLKIGAKFRGNLEESQVYLQECTSKIQDIYYVTTLKQSMVHQPDESGCFPGVRLQSLARKYSVPSRRANSFSWNDVGNCSKAYLKLPVSSLEQLFGLVMCATSSNDELIYHHLFAQGIHGEANCGVSSELRLRWRRKRHVRFVMVDWKKRT